MARYKADVGEEDVPKVPKWLLSGDSILERNVMESSGRSSTNYNLGVASLVQQ